MTALVTTAPGQHRSLSRSSASDSIAARVLIGIATTFLGLFLGFPLVTVFCNAFSGGFGAYVSAVRDPMTLCAIRLTLLTAAIAVPLNLLFGFAAAWLISKYDFWGKGLLVSLMDLPFSVSPVVSGLVFVLLFGRSGWFGDACERFGVKVIYAVPGIVLATVFVTFPIIARELLLVMQAQGSEEEQAGLTLGANGWQILRRITLPKVKWGVIYGAILCNARAMGEFGAVSVVSGHIRGETNTMPLHIEILYGEYNTQAAFAIASLLTLLALATLGLKHWVQWRVQRQWCVPPPPADNHGDTSLVQEGVEA